MILCEIEWLSMPALDAIRLRCSDPEAQKRFYCDVLGMRERANGTIGYADEEAGLLFEVAEVPYRPSPNDLYWKIALAVPNIDLAYGQLTEMGLEVQVPRQVGDVAYLAHFKDPEGFTIELLDHWFVGDRPSEEFDTQRLGGSPCLNLLTLRAADVGPLDRSVKTMGMTPLSVVPVPTAGFTLYFYAFTDERPPNADLLAIENRTWVYQRPYTVLEIQHVSDAGRMKRPQTREGGYAGTLVSGTLHPFHDGHLRLYSEAKPTDG